MNRHVIELLVPASSIDQVGHVNNVEYVKWMQDAAIAHSDAVGCTAATHGNGAVWVARRHQIEYLRPAFEGDRLEIRTWVTDYRRASSLRCYEFVRPADDTLIARGETDWVYVDAATGRPKSIPENVRELFDLTPEGEPSDG
jgi:acyl-CoA thioester hydrolase